MLNWLIYDLCAHNENTFNLSPLRDVFTVKVSPILVIVIDLCLLSVYLYVETGENFSHVVFRKKIDKMSFFFGVF